MKKIRALAALTAALALTLSLGTVAYAGGGEQEPEEPVTESAVQEAEPNPFTPDGTGTVLDNATDGDGKEFFTITTASDNVYYLIIDRQRSTENVYFLNAVTEADLLALAEPSESVSAIPDPEPEAPATEANPAEPEDTPAEEPAAPEKKGNTGMMVLLFLILAGGGGAGYYFKVLRPKQQRVEDEDDSYSEYEDDADPYADSFDDAGQDEDDSPPWDVDEDSDNESGGEDE